METATLIRVIAGIVSVVLLIVLIQRRRSKVR
jgi:hypothetical protein